MSQVYSIVPVPKPRMTKRDKWAGRPPVLRYLAYKDECQLNRVTLPQSGYHITFVMPMPSSWSKKKKSEYNRRPHQQKPDKDNLEKALLDAVMSEDCAVWDGRVTKIWGYQGLIIIDQIGQPENLTINDIQAECTQ